MIVLPKGKQDPASPQRSAVARFRQRGHQVILACSLAEITVPSQVPSEGCFRWVAELPDGARALADEGGGMSWCWVTDAASRSADQPR